MPVTAVKELARKAVAELGATDSLTREFVAVLGDNTLSGNPQATGEVITACGVLLRAPHPEYPRYGVRKITIDEGYEGSPYHTHLVAEYGPISANEALAPTSRAATWEFESAPGQVPALFYYDGTTKKPLTNSANDAFEGLVVEESLVAIRVTKNFAQVPYSWISKQNYVNSDGDYLGAGQYALKIAKVVVRQAQEEFGGAVESFWQATAEIHYRESTHVLQLPDVGFNYLQDGQKRRAVVYDYENAEWVASPNPVGLNGSGGQTFGAPVILQRRVNPATNFAALFGAAPTNPI